MVRLMAVIAYTLFFVNLALAGTVGDWWESVKDLHLNSHRYEQIQQMDQCSERLQYYRQKVQENPDSEYFKGKLEKWQERCE